MLTLSVPVDIELSSVARWRNASRESLRTAALTTRETQKEWFRNLDPYVHRYWSVDKDNVMVAFGGLTYISWESRTAEISLIVDPGERRKGIGMEAVDLILNEGFNNMNLIHIYGEVYLCNPAIKFWEKVIEKYSASVADLPDRKYWDGRYYDSLYFSIARSDYA